jgi:hypothetical protein
MVFLQKWSELEEINAWVMDHSNSASSNLACLIICETSILTEQIIQPLGKENLSVQCLHVH